MRRSVFEFVKSLGLQPVILHEQPSRGDTIIEKIEKHSGWQENVAKELNAAVYEIDDLRMRSHFAMPDESHK